MRACCGVGATGAYEYCAKKKIPRDSNGEPTGEAPEDGPSKYVEGSDGAVCPASGESHVPDEHYWVWLDQWVMDAADAHAYAADLVSRRYAPRLAEMIPAERRATRRARRRVHLGGYLGAGVGVDVGGAHRGGGGGGGEGDASPLCVQH